MKLIKINTDHYVVVDDSEIKEGDWYVNNKVIFRADDVFDEGNNPNQRSNNKKITHSTQPLYKNDFWAIQELKLSEVKELIGEVDVEQIAVDFAGDRKLGAGHGYPSFEANLLERGFLSGYNQALEDNKGKKYTEEDMVEAFKMGLMKLSDQRLKDYMQPKTDWEVEFVDEKLKLK